VDIIRSISVSHAYVRKAFADKPLYNRKFSLSANILIP